VPPVAVAIACYKAKKTFSVSNTAGNGGGGKRKK
jgi:hypothetical protein